MNNLPAFLLFLMFSLEPGVLVDENKNDQADAPGVCSRSPEILLETTGDARQFCSRFRGFCESAKVAFLADGFACTWQCTSWWGDPGRKVSGCHWDCETPLPSQAEGARGNGARLAFLNIRECDALAGRQVLEGFAMKFLKGVASLKFYWNGAPIEPLSLQTGLPNIEATLLPNGPGTLGLVATDFDGWASKHELDVVIANRGDESDR
jgi:hypothetical protein